MKMKNDVDYTIDLISNDKIKEMEDHILLALTKHTDKKIDEYIKQKNKEDNAVRLAQLRHMEVVEKYLKGFNILLEKLK
jgi:hypothetical protein